MKNIRLRIVTYLFFISGLTSLIYQVYWQKKIFTLLGSDIYATSMNLSAFMLGLSLGSYLIGIFVDNIKYRIVIYGLIEILIGVFALQFDIIISTLAPFLHNTYNLFFLSNPLYYHSIKFILLFLVLLIPTMLMGATLLNQTGMRLFSMNMGFQFFIQTISLSTTLRFYPCVSY